MEDYPRKMLSEYQRRHERDPQKVIELTYTFTEEELESIEKLVGFKVSINPSLSVSYNYANTSFNHLSIN